MKKSLVVLLALATVFAILPVANATEIGVVGSLDVTGHQNPWTATQIQFNNLSANGSAAGTSDNITALFGENNIPTTIEFTPIVYSSTGSEVFLTGSEGGDSYTFTLVGPVTLDDESSHVMDFEGVGILTVTGYAPTEADIYFSANDVTGHAGSTGTSSWSATIDAEGVVAPEPGSLVLFGTGLIGFAGLLRRKYMVSR
ncbi:MAG: PEP-CTERM sorting domain-containing protein [Terracidiphilus sp.]|jgi:hypothetical protein